MTQRAIDGPFIYLVTTNTTFRRRFFDVPEKAEALGAMIRKIARRHQFKLYAYCILPDHVHMLIEKFGNSSLSLFMNNLKGRYSFEGDPGRLWQPRFNFRIIEDEGYFINAVEYIMNNFKKHELDDRYGKTPYVFVDWGSIKDVYE